MTNYDPRDPVRNAPYNPVDPAAPYNDPRDGRGNSLGLIGGLAAALIVVVLLASMWGGGNTTDQSATAPRTTTGQGADPTTTGSVPGRTMTPQQTAPAPAPLAPAPMAPSPAPTTPAPSPQQ